MENVRLFCVIALLALLLCSCDQGSCVEIRIEGSHPWERASGRQFWYTLVFLGEAGLEQVNLPIGVRRASITVPRSRTVVFAAYPLGTGFPFGGALSVGNRDEKILLTAANGPLCDALLHIAKTWPLPVAQVNYERLVDAVRQADERRMHIDWNRLATDISNGRLSNASVQRGLSREVLLREVPEGKWVCEAGSFGSFTVFNADETILGELPPGLLRYVNLSGRMELRVIVPSDAQEAPFYYLAPLDTLLALSDPAYHDLIRASESFTENE